MSTAKTKEDPAQAVVAFASAPSSRFAMNVPELASDLELLGGKGAAWPRCSARQWERVLRQALATGKLILDSAGHVGPPEPPKDLTQLELFE